MAFTAARSPAGTMSEINITPLVDVMLVLLVIFMVTAPMLDFRLQVGLPQADRTPSPPTEPLVLAVERGDLFRLAGTPVSGPALAKALQALASDQPERLLRIEVDPDADYQSAATALAAVERAGVTRFALAD